jgi:integrase
MGEVLSARKADFDLNRGVWIKPSHQTKQRRTEHLPLSAPAASLVASILQENPGSQYLFPGNITGEHLTDIKKFWAAAIRKASIPD